MDSTPRYCPTRDMVDMVQHHKYWLGQMVLAMRMVATLRFRYSAPLVPWTEAELDKLHIKWLQIQRATTTSKCYSKLIPKLMRVKSSCSFDLFYVSNPPRKSAGIDSHR